MTSYSIQVPFCGFHESEADAVIQQELERAFDNQEIPQNFWDHWDHRPISVSFSKVYTSLFNDYFKKHTGFNLDLRFEELDSPKYYDERTDKIYARISEETLETLYDSADKAVLSHVIQERFKPEIGEKVSYSNNINDTVWTQQVSQWDLKQLETLLLSVLGENDVMDIDYDEIIGDMDVSKIVWENCSDICLQILNSHQPKEKQQHGYHE